MTDLDKLLNELAKIVEPVVEAIEAKPPTTSGHYGEYMTAIATIAAIQPKAGPNIYLAIGVALQQAGANKGGVMSALKVMGKI